MRSSRGPQGGEGRTGRWHGGARLRRRLRCGGDGSAPRELDASHSTAGFAGHCLAQRLDVLTVEIAAAGERRRQWQSRYLSGDQSEGRRGSLGSR